MLLDVRYNPELKNWSEDEQLEVLAQSYEGIVDHRIKVEGQSDGCMLVFNEESINIIIQHGCLWLSPFQAEQLQEQLKKNKGT